MGNKNMIKKNLYFKLFYYNIRGKIKPNTCILFLLNLKGWKHRVAEVGKDL